MHTNTRKGGAHKRNTAWSRCRSASYSLACKIRSAYTQRTRNWQMSRYVQHFGFVLVLGSTSNDCIRRLQLCYACIISVWHDFHYIFVWTDLGRYNDPLMPNGAGSRVDGASEESCSQVNAAILERPRNTSGQHLVECAHQETDLKRTTIKSKCNT